tara:strand:- start:364 stop:1116 length:753 start_codon:yes stop_codon:yes gene_type:complete
MKWMMGWMNDSLKFFEKDTAFRKWHQDQLTFSLVYAFSENFMLPLSHDEVVYGKNSLVMKMPGDEWQRFANLRLLFTFMYTHPGTKLMFMGGEFGQTSEWNFEQSLDWHLLDFAPHKGMQSCVKALNKLYKTEPAMYELGFNAEGFEWIDTMDRENSILTYARKSNSSEDSIVVVLNLTPVPRPGYRIGVLAEGMWEEIFNTDSSDFFGTGIVNSEPIKTEKETWHNKPNSLILDLPPLGATIIKVKSSQ